MHIDPKTVTHIKLKRAVYPGSVFLTAGTIHPVKDYESGQFRVEDPEFPGTPLKDWWIDADLAIPIDAS